MLINKEKLNLPIDKCYGCFACYSSCPTGAIKMDTRKTGFYYPKINLDLCVGCKKCENVCKKIHESSLCNLNSIYAARSTDSKKVLNSSSGGIFSEIAENIIRNNGYVVGCTNDHNKVHHIIINKESDIVLLQGSKYVQSDIGDCFIKVKRLLINNKVLFVGTPCQVAGLKAFLGTDNVNLFLVDVFCHGVPSPIMFEQYIKKIENKNKSKVKKFSFRGKYCGWDEFFRIQFQNNNVKTGPALMSSYYRLFLDSDINNEACLICKFKSINRCSDLSIGDCWNVKEKTDDEEYIKGSTSVVINTERGLCLINKLYEEKKIVFFNIDKDFVVSNNTGALKPMITKEFPYKLHNDWKDKGYSVIEKEYFKKYFSSIFKYQCGRFLPLSIKKKIKRIFN